MNEAPTFVAVGNYVPSVPGSEPDEMKEAALDCAPSDTFNTRSGASPPTAFPELNMARAYLTALTREENPVVTFQTFTDAATKSNPDSLAYIFHGTLDEHAPALTRLNNQGAGVFVMVNEGDLKGRKAENVTRIRAAFVDHDKPDTRPLAMAPSFSVTTSPGKRHDYLLVEGDLPLPQFKPLQKVLIEHCGSDPGVHDLPRVMRLPDFYHRKKAPYLVMFEPGSGRTYTPKEILEAHEKAWEAVANATVTTPGPSVTTNTSTLEAVANPTRRDKLVRIARDKAAERDWTEGSRHASAKETAAHSRKLGLDADEIYSIVADLLESAGTTREEAKDIVEWTMTNVTPDPDEVDPPRRNVIHVYGGDGVCTSPRPNPYRQTPGQALAKIGMLGAAIPMEGLPTFNALSEGGLRSGECIAFGGPSGVGKTGFAVMAAKKSAELGRPTAGYFVDQSPAAATVRLGQLFGMDRGRLEDPKKFTDSQSLVDRFVAGLPAPLWFTDVDEDDVNVTANAADLRLMADGRESTLIVDSLNLAPVAGIDADDERLRIRDTAIAIANERKRYDMAVIATCETNRSGGQLAIYGSGLLNLEFRVDLLATIAESRAIAHAFDRIAVMFGDPERAVRVFLVKNRRGPKGSWWMRMDPVTSGWAEISADEAEEQIRHDGEAKTAGKVARDAPVVLDFLKRMRIDGKGPQTTNAVCQGTDLSWRRVKPAMESLQAKGAVRIDTDTKKTGAKASWAVC
jgi:hypothetical protein